MFCKKCGKQLPASNSVVFPVEKAKLAPEQLTLLRALLALPQK